MELQHVNVKLFVDGKLPVEPARFIEVFHAWIRESVLSELLVDVADYRHVPAGPGVLLVGHESDYSMDNTDDRWGLRYNRKAPLEGNNEDRFRQALGSAVNACRLLEKHFAGEGPLTFSRKEFDLFVNDRAFAPNTADTFAACKPELDSFLTTALGHNNFALAHHADPRQRFGVTVKTAEPFDLSQLGNTLLVQS